LAREALEVGLGLEGFEVTRSAVHEKVDDAAGARRVMRLAGMNRGRGGCALAREEPGESDRAEAAAGLPEEAAACRRGVWPDVAVHRFAALGTQA
jgi:hypothetical protein